MLIIDDDVNPGLRGGVNPNDYLTVPQPFTNVRNSVLNPRAVEFYFGCDNGGGSSNNNESTDANANANTLWTSQNILSWYSRSARVTAENFPSLAVTNENNSTSDAKGNGSNTALQDPKSSQPKQTNTTTITESKSLMKISNMVQKVNPKQLEKQ